MSSRHRRRLLHAANEGHRIVKAHITVSVCERWDMVMAMGVWWAFNRKEAKESKNNPLKCLAGCRAIEKCLVSCAAHIYTKLMVMI